ncbi:uncharacterized protein [Typha latifolia]|uniref:uncharacterized protein isoform X2 n=1 Tax=Typha latifolia TaxID=4733 RepID=UPI003C2B2600
MDGEGDEELLVEEREVEMVTFADPGEPIKRNGWFINPCANQDGGLLRAPYVPLRYKGVSFIAPEEPRVFFKGWSSSPRLWDQWVGKLRPKYGDCWKKAGILEAILASTYRIRRDPSAIFGVSAFWCEETNSFLFPWGEATISLEDVMILGGFPVLGEPVRESLVGELKDIEAKMTEERLRFNRISCKKADHSAWMKHYMERDGDELEHIAFLSLWLSRFVFCSHPEKTLKQHVFPIAIRLARGVKIALGPAVLATIYRDLRELKEYLVAGGSTKEYPLVVWAPLHVMQLWVWERFPSLRPEGEKSLDSGEPRAARWHDVGKKMDFSFVQVVLESPTEFLWRPYAVSLSNWCKPKFYKESGAWIRGDAGRDEESRQFAHCIRACELVGLDCIEQYLPHRVAMQFGLNQDLPCSIPRANSNWEVAWETYDIAAKNVAFYVPPHLLELNVTLAYSRWWKQHMLDCGIAADENVNGSESPKFVKRLQEMTSVEKKKKIRTLPNGKKRKVQDLYDTTLSEWLAFNNCNIRLKKKYMESNEPTPHVVEIQKQRTNVMRPMDQFTRGEGEIKQVSEACNDAIIEDRAPIGETSVSAVLDKVNKATIESVERRIVEEYRYEPTALKHEETLSADQEQGKKSKRVMDDYKEKVIVEDTKRTDDGVSPQCPAAIKKHEEALLPEKEIKRGDNKEIMEMDKENADTVEDVKRVDNGEFLCEPTATKRVVNGGFPCEPTATQESGEALPSEQANQREEHKGVANMDEDRAIVKDNKRIKVESPCNQTVAKETDEALSPEQANQRGESKDIVDKDKGDILINVKIANAGELSGPEKSPQMEQAKQIREDDVILDDKNDSVQDLMKMNDGEFLCDLSFGKEVEENLTPEQASKRRENKVSVDKNQQEVVAEDVKSINDSESPHDSTVVREAEQALPPEQANRIEQNKQVLDKDQEEKGIVNDFKRTNDGESLHNSSIVKEAEGTVPPEDASGREVNKAVLDKGQEEKSNFENFERTNDGDNPCDLTVVKEAERTLPPEQANGKEDKKIVLDKDQEDKAIVEDVERTSDGESPCDSAGQANQQGDKVGIEDGVKRTNVGGSGHDSINVHDPSGMEGKGSLKDVKQTTILPDEILLIKKPEGTVLASANKRRQNKASREDFRRRNTGLSAYRQLKEPVLLDKENKTTIQDVNRRRSEMVPKDGLGGVLLDNSS